MNAIARGTARLWTALLTLTCLAGANPAAAQTVDQSQTTANIVALINGARAQTFTPTLNSLNFVDLYIADMLEDTLGAGFLVRIRGGSPDGAVLGTSNPRSLPSGYGFDGGVETRFTFPDSVSLTPGSTHALEVIQVNGGDFGLGYGLADPYAGGEAYSGGTAQGHLDMWFREGVLSERSAVPEPGALALFLPALGVVGLLRRRRA